MEQKQMISTFTRMMKTGLAVVLTAALIALASLVVYSGINARLLKAANPDLDTKKHFDISGEVVGLYPGSDKELSLTVENPHSFDIIVRRIDVHVIGSDTMGCPKSDVIGGSFATLLEIPKKGSVQTTVPVSMVADSDNDCQGARFSFRYGGEAAKK